VLGHVLPERVSWVDARTDAVPPGSLYPEEQTLVAAAVAKRQREFGAVRVCARRALSVLKVPAQPLLRGSRGEPLWPSGVVGSMTHCPGYYAAAVASSADVQALGVDAERHAPLPEGILDAISLPAERKHVHWVGGPMHLDRLLFSAKESVFKALYPLTHVALGFEDAHIAFETRGATEGVFRVRLRRQVPVAPVPFSGRWAVREGFALTAVTIPAGMTPSCCGS
jgi:4'-phosphopantetheinyl transferase EntD